MEKGLRAGSGQVNVQRYRRDLLGIISRGEFDVTFVIIHRWPLDRAPEAYEMFDAKEDNCLKMLPTSSREEVSYMEYTTHNFNNARSS